MANVLLGYRYRSRAILSGEEDGGAMSENPREPSVAPGFRLPHHPVSVRGRSRSTHDLIGRGFALVTGAEGGRWKQAAENIAARSAFPLTAYRIGADVESTCDLHELLRLGRDRALLVRPDGFVAWRSSSDHEDAEARLDEALNEICARPRSMVVDRVGAEAC